jgi:D-amino-acid oxidase
MTQRPPVLVLGSGIVGLTTAVVLAEAGWAVHIRTAKGPADTTSAAAGALWGPWLVEPRDRVLTWAANTLVEYRELARLDGTGVRLTSGREVSRIDHAPPDWAALLPDQRKCNPDELPPDYPYGVTYTAPLVTMLTHMDYLVARFRTAGGEIEVNRLDDLQEVTSHLPVVVNCTGIGARELLNDTDLYPVRGQQLVVTNPGITEFLEVDTGDSTDLTAIYPHGDHLVLSGTAEPNTWTLEPDPRTAESILQRCIRVEPRIADAKVVAHRVGLRPQRSQIRLESERTPAGILVHNYGHGGAGVSLAWACAKEVLAEVDRVYR